jgi:hypothetical protein
MTKNIWTKAGLLIAPDPDIWWMNQHVGPSFLQLKDEGQFDLYVTGRDMQNISRIGVIQGEIVDHQLLLGATPRDPIFDIGDPGLAITTWLKANPEILEKAGLFCEDGNDDWIHFQNKPFGSYKPGGTRWFKP